MSSHDAVATSGGKATIVVNVVFCVLAIVAVVGRFHSRNLTGRKASIDDYLIIAGLIFTIATVIVGVLMVTSAGVGLQMTDATLGQVENLLKLFVPAPLLWAFATTCVKLSILFFYTGIFQWPGFRPAAYVVMGFTMALWLVTVVATFTLCRPFAYSWDKTIPNGVCGDSFKLYLSVAIVNLIVDLAIVALPMPVLWRLQMSTEKKLAITAILALGLIVSIFSALRIDAVVQLDPLNFTYTVVPDLIFGGMEISLGIICACLPVMQPMMKKHFGVDGVFSRLMSRMTTNRSTEHSGKSSQKMSTKSSWNPRSRPDDVDALYPITATSFVDVEMERREAQARERSYDSSHDITVTQHLQVSSVKNDAYQRV